MSQAWPGERNSRTGRPSWSTTACILVLSAPRERPMALSGPLFCVGGVLVGLDDRTESSCINCGERAAIAFEYPQPDTCLRPSGVAVEDSRIKGFVKFTMSLNRRMSTMGRKRTLVRRLVKRPLPTADASEAD
jgi:hypothetical protein